MNINDDNSEPIKCYETKESEVQDGQKNVGEQSLSLSQIADGKLHHESAELEKAVVDGEIYPGPPKHMDLDWYRSAMNTRLRFKTYVGVEFDFTESKQKEQWSSFSRRNRMSGERTEKWDDKWYWWTCATTPSVKNNTVMIVSDLDRKVYCAATFRNTDRWHVITNEHPIPGDIPNGATGKVNFTISGSEFQFDFRNPKNVNGFTANDMVVSWGYD